VLDLPEPVDLAVIALPAPAVLEAAEQCGQRGVRSLVVVTSGLEAAARAELLAVCRRHGMRLVGPDCFGVAVPGLGLNATFAASQPRTGVAGLVMQSGGLGFAMVDQLSRLGIGISSFASVGDKLDVSSNDMLLWWEHDGVTKLAVLYIESFGNPRKFARTARRVSATMPVLTVLGRQGSGVQAAAGYQTASRPAVPLASREALFEQAGVIVTRGYGELIEATALLATQPVPAGRTVAIVSNVGSAALLAANACTDLGLTVTDLLDTGATVSGRDFRQCLGLLAADDEGRVPAHGYPEAAVAAMARAASYGAWRAAPCGHMPDFADIRAADARTLAYEFLRQTSGGCLSPGQTADLLGCYGIVLAGGEDTSAPVAPRAGWTEVIVRVAADDTFGPLVMVGPGGAPPMPAGLADGHAARLTPLTDIDADQLIRDVAPGNTYLRDLLLRISRLADDRPEITRLDLSPVIAGPDGAIVRAARSLFAPNDAIAIFRISANNIDCKFVSDFGIRV